MMGGLIEALRTAQRSKTFEVMKIAYCSVKLWLILPSALRSLKVLAAMLT